MNKILDTLSAEIERAAAIEDELFELAGGNDYAWRLLTELVELNINIGRAFGKAAANG
jgi:hypothetical protein